MKRTALLGLLRLFRLELPLSAGICVILGQLLARRALPPASDAALGFLSIFFLSATALILNDYFDSEVDRINAPERPLPSGQVTRPAALGLSFVVAALGLICAGLLGTTPLFVAAGVWLIGVAYNWRLKRTGLLGNLLVAVSVGMTFVYGGIIAGRPADPIVWWFGLLAFLFDLAEEILADAMDVEGDRRIGSRSLAIVIGPRNALRVGGGVFAAVILVSLFPFARGWLDRIDLIPILLMDAVILYGMVRLLSPTARRPRRYIRGIYLGGSASILLFILLRWLRP